MVGAAAVKAAIKGTSGKMVTLVRHDEDGNYRCTTGPGGPGRRGQRREAAAQGVHQHEPARACTEAFRDYALPLIAGEAEIEIGDDGLPVYARLAKHMVPQRTGRAYRAG